MKLSIIVPAHNEEDNIEEVVHKIEATVSVPFELVVVDDHSVDGTAVLIKRLSGQYNNIRLVENKLDKGFANAVKSGFASAGGDVFIPVMADLCDDLAVINGMLEKISSGYDIVCGSRYSHGGRRLGGSRFKGFLSASAGR